MSAVTLLTSETWVGTWPPYRPLATDDLAAGCWRQSRDSALGRRYLEHSPKALLSSLVIDVDHPDTLFRAFGEGVPGPSWIAESISGRGHVGWLLAAPVCRTDAARLKPLNLAALVQEGLRRTLDGDPGYGGLLTKNPTHSDWFTTWGREEPWELRELAKVLGKQMPPRLPRRRGEIAGLGRNVDLFNELRGWAYGQCYRYSSEPESAWVSVVLDRAAQLNMQFPTPLPASEIKSVAESVGKWTHRRFTRERFSVIQHFRGLKRAAQPSAAGARSRGGAANTPAQQAQRLERASKGGLATSRADLLERASRGGRANTPAQQQARRRNLAKASLVKKVDRALVLEVEL